MGKYRIFGADGVPFGGMMDKPADVPMSDWAFYVNVDGIDAAVGADHGQGRSGADGPARIARTRRIARTSWSR